MKFYNMVSKICFAYATFAYSLSFFYIIFGFFLSFVWRLGLPSNISWIPSLIFILLMKTSHAFSFQRIDSYSIFIRKCHLMRGKKIKHFYGLPKYCKNLQTRWYTKFKTFTKWGTLLSSHHHAKAHNYYFWYGWVHEYENVVQNRNLTQKRFFFFFPPPYKYK
jgi:hypothetical protein